jgi:gluconate 2-dehydrogenase gamma chain
MKVTENNGEIDNDRSSGGPHLSQESSLSHISRRKALGAAGVAVGAVMTTSIGEAAQTDGPVTLIPSEYETLAAVCARIIPSDENGPGAAEAQAVRFIDRGLGGALASSLVDYRTGLTALDIYSNTAHGGDFSTLTEAEQDEVLEAVQDNLATGFPANPAQFFNMVRGHTIQGTFSDPFYGGNANFVGWDMIGYPGVRTAVPAQYQQIGADHTPNHQSVYDFTMFDEGEV